MKKVVFFKLFAFTLLVILLITGCSNKQDSRLVGRWELTSNSYSWGDVIILNRDGTGVYAGPITWKIENNRLYLLAPSGFVHPEYEYTLSGSELTLSALGETAVYTKRN